MHRLQKPGPMCRAPVAFIMVEMGMEMEMCMQPGQGDGVLYKIPVPDYQLAQKGNPMRANERS